MILIGLLKALLLPPSGPILLGLVALMLLRWRRTAGMALLIVSVVLTYLCSIGLTANLLSRIIETYEPVTTEAINAGRPGAIVVLGGGIDPQAPEYGHDTVHIRTLGRIRYAARLARQTGLPVLASSGYGYAPGMEQEAPEAELMRRVLEEDFGISSVLAETSSHNTWENAANSAAILKSRGIDTILLVTQAAHMRRSVESFQRAGIKVIPAPTLFSLSKIEPFDLAYWIPSAASIYAIYYLSYEWIGLIWYRWREAKG
ncbi:MAG TPA: YdcF family protein [Candidatus Competibacteraceae bacterium]|nr:YdcF family protein [Candidatus Competibacteraceae bacterium]